MNLKDRIEAMRTAIAKEEKIIGESRDRLNDLYDKLGSLNDSVERGLDALSGAKSDLSEAIDALSEYL